jgi:hypothetical protein
MHWWRRRAQSTGDQLAHSHSRLVSLFSRQSCVVQLTKSLVGTTVGVVQHARIRSIDRSLLLRRCREGVHSAAAEGFQDARPGREGRRVLVCFSLAE